MTSKKPVMQASTVQKKDYSYELGNTKLTFTLRTDVKTELIAFRDLMDRAYDDINADLETLDNK